MRVLRATGQDAEPLLAAMHCLLAVPPLVNFLLSPLFAQELVRKRVNAVAFAQGVRQAAGEYYRDGGPVDVDAPLQAFRRIHRSSHACAAVAVRQMYQALRDACDVPDSTLEELGGNWVVHNPGTPCQTVQSLFNLQPRPEPRHLLFVRLDRGDRPRKFVNYGTSVKLVTGSGREMQQHTYDLVAVLVQGPQEAPVVMARCGRQWNVAAEGEVGPLADVNSIINGSKAQALAFLLRPAVRR